MCFDDERDGLIQAYYLEYLEQLTVRIQQRLVEQDLEALARQVAEVLHSGLQMVQRE